VAALDASRITYPLLVRRWKKGDRFVPLGMKGSKKVSDFLVDQKVPLPEKSNIWVIESGGQIVWIVNHRIDERFKVTDGTTEILQVQYTDTASF
jgi:tRNA(Ile)-lysidine synthase